MDAFDAYDECAEMHAAAIIVARRDSLMVTEVLYLPRFQEAAEIVERLLAKTDELRAAVAGGGGLPPGLTGERAKIAAELADKLGVPEITGAAA